MTRLRTVAYVFLTGYILCFFSEWMFWSGRPVAADFAITSLPTWLLYSFITFLFLALVDYFHVRSVWAIFLAGAVYGWLLEGVIVQTTYDNFPFNVSFTALAWHAIISVLFGVYWLPCLLRRRRAALACAGFGLLLGLWSIGWWTETPPAPIESVVLYNFAFGIGLALAYSVRERFSFSANRIAVYAAIGLLGAYFVVVTIPTQPLAAVVLPILFGVTLLALRQNRQQEASTINTLSAQTDSIRFANTLPVLLIPLVTSLVYTAALLMGIAFPGLQIAYVILMPAGFILFVVSLFKVSSG